MYLIILVLLILFFMTIGFRLIINASIWLSGISNDSEVANEQSDDSTFFLAPELLNFPDATNSARIKVSGRGTADTTLHIYVNDEEVETLDLDEDSFDASLQLETGENKIYLETEDTKNKKSKDSEVYTIVVITEGPTLSIDSPIDGDTVDTDSINVLGETTPGVSLRINNSPVVVAGDGSFRKNLRLKEGENKISVRAIDLAGNEEEVEITIRYERD